MMDAASGWWVIVPMKDTRLAKSRLEDRRGERRKLAVSMARDTLGAALNACRVDGVLVVCQCPEDVESFSLPGVRVAVRAGLGLNEAVLAGVEALAADGITSNVAVLPGDLPYLRAGELDAALARAATVEVSCVADRSGRGTTLLASRSARSLNPAYGADSWRAHRTGGAVDLGAPAWSGLRRDVDLPGDLIAGPALGSRTRDVLEQRGAPGQLLEGSGSR